MTSVVKSIGSGGGNDYADPASFWAAIPSSCVLADQQWIGEFDKTTEFTGSAPLLTMTPKGTDATRNIILRCKAGHAFNDNAGKLSNALDYNAANGVALRSTGGSGAPIVIAADDYIELYDLQIAGLTGEQLAVEQSVTGTNVKVNRCIAKQDTSASGGGPFKMNGGSVSNSLCITTGGGSGYISAFSAGFHNCTAVQTGAATNTGFHDGYDSPLFLNSVSLGFGTSFGTFSVNGSSDYNATDKSSAPGAHSVGSLVFANQVVSVTNDFRVKSGNGLGGGVRDAAYTFDLDILKQARSTTSPTRGCMEYVTAGPGASSAPPRRAFNQQILQH